VDELLKNKLDLQVLTDTGWSNFDGLLRRGNKQTVLLTTQTRHIICTLDHKFFTPEFNMKSAQSLLPGDNVLTDENIETIVSIKLANIEPVYDLLEVKKNHRFYANGILVKNCEFLIFDETLINSFCLAEMESREPIERQGQVRWFQRPQRGRTYTVALDPSLGTGGDPAAIQIFELPTMIQIGEWQHNKTPIQRQIAILKEICEYIYDTIGTQNDIYYSVENNTLGEAALISINEIGEENIRGFFLSQPVRIGQARTHRKGFTTTNKTKIAVCAKLKNLVENKKMTIYSKNLISEFKNFVAAGVTFKAKTGETDDLVMATLLALRMIQSLQSYDSDLDEKLKDSADDYIAPMPFIMV
jgi:hypothetical protein